MVNTSVILADDHALVRAGIRNALQELPNLTIVEEASDGPALFEALETERPDLLIVDLHMPDFNPLTDIRRIHEQYSGMRILVISAYDDDVYVQGVLSIGVDGYHLKDQSLSDLKLAVKRVLKGERWLSSPLVDKLVHYDVSSESKVSLTTRQRDLLRLLQQGLDNQSMAQRLGLSVKTVENHLTRLYRRLDVSSRLEAANYAMHHPEVLGLPGKQIKEHSPLPRPSAPSSHLTILLVDDSNRYRTQLRRMVGRAYPEAVIYEADDLGEAVRLTKSLAPSLAFVDVVLGDEDGIRCTRRLLGLCPSARVVLISAYPDREFHRLGKESGAIAFVDKKDLDVATVRHIIEDALG